MFTSDSTQQYSLFEHMKKLTFLKEFLKIIDQFEELSQFYNPNSEVGTDDAYCCGHVYITCVFDETFGFEKQKYST